MKKFYFFILTLITTLFVLGLAALKVNEIVGNKLFAIPVEYQKYVDFAVEYGAMTLLCLFAFGGLAGKFIKFIVIMLIVIAVVIFIVAAVAPNLIEKVVGGVLQIQSIL